MHVIYILTTDLRTSQHGFLTRMQHSPPNTREGTPVLWTAVPYTCRVSCLELDHISPTQLDYAIFTYISADVLPMSLSTPLGSTRG